MRKVGGRGGEARGDENEKHETEEKCVEEGKGRII